MPEKVILKQQQVKKPDKRKDNETVDGEEQIARRAFMIQEKRQRVIEEVNRSLEKRRQEKTSLQDARLEKKIRAGRKTTRDSEKSASQKKMLQIRKDLSGIVESGIKYVFTSAIIPKKITFDGRATLTIKDVRYKIKQNLHIVGWGKEAVTMSAAFERVVGKQLKKGWMVVPRKSIFMMWNFPEAFPPLNSRISYFEAGSDGEPDDRSVEATRKIVNYCKKLKKRDILLVILSQGVDDLLCCPREEITLRDQLRVLNRLKAAEATPEEINIVRNKLSSIRGGDLARTAYPAKVITMITSDVSREPMSKLSGGPCAYESKDGRALAILMKYDIFGGLTHSVRQLVMETVPANAPADKQLNDKNKYKFVDEYVIACNADAMEGMAAEAFRVGLVPLKLNSTCSGDVEEFAREYVKLTSLIILAVEGKITKYEMYEEMKESAICPLTEKKVQEIFPVKDKWGLGLCLLLGGRPTVNLCLHPGKGGPNQELSLYFSLFWNLRTKQYPILREYTVWFLGGSSYGRDGNTSAAGAFGYKNLSTDVYPAYKKARNMYYAAHLEWLKLIEYSRGKSEIAQAETAMKELRLIKNKYEAITPEKCLKENNTNLMFLSINDEDELLELETGNYYTFTNVGDLHAIQIVRFQCNCDGTCHGNEDRICTDRECPVNLLSTGISSKLQYCCSSGRPKDQ